MRNECICKNNTIPEYFVFINKKWVPRKQGEPVQGFYRIYNIHPRVGKCYYLRLLMVEVCGPTSFNDFKMHEGVSYETYREACRARGLLAEGQHLRLALQDAVVESHPKLICDLFCTILTCCEPISPIKLWEEFKDDIAQDILHQHRQIVNNEEADFNDDIYNKCLVQIEDKLLCIGGRHLNSYGLPSTIRSEFENHYDVEYQREINYNCEEEAESANNNIARLNNEQNIVFKEFTEMIADYEAGEQINENIIFLDDPGGTGKTFLINTMLAHIRGQGKIAIAASTSGIAATLLSGGRTVHSTFKVPLNTHLNETPFCNIARGTALAELLKATSVIIVDETTMAHKTVYEAMDGTFQDILQNNMPFGGIPVLLCGDFRQLLPVVKSGTQAQIVKASIKKSYLWRRIKVSHLTINMQVFLSENNQTTEANFSTTLLQLGEGRLPIVDDNNTVFVPHNLGQVVNSIEQLKETVFPNLMQMYTDTEWLSQRAILCPLNANVNKINNDILNKIPGEENIFRSIDTAITDNEAILYPAEFLNALNPSGLPSG